MQITQNHMNTVKTIDESITLMEYILFERHIAPPREQEHWPIWCLLRVNGEFKYKLTLL